MTPLSRMISTAVPLIALATAGYVMAAHRIEPPKQSSAPTPSSPDVVPDSGLSGKALVEQQCTSCHSEPKPSGLPKELWPLTLHTMGFYLGMHGDELPDLKMNPKPVEPSWADYITTYEVTDAKGEKHISPPFTQFIQPDPIISKADWLRIRDYFVSNALSWDEMYKRRQNLPEMRRALPILKGFTPVVPKLDLDPNGWILSTAVDEARHRLYVGHAAETTNWETGEARSKVGNVDELLAFDLRSGKQLGRVPTGTNPIRLETTATGVRLSTYGVWPITIGKGRSQMTDWEFDGGRPRGRRLVNGQQLIIDHHTQDLNGDGRPDIVLNAYADGISTCCDGQLAVYWQTPEYKKIWANAPEEIPPGELAGALRKTVLLEQSGIIDSQIADINNDGKPDIVALVAQAKQQVLVFINNGDETFTEHVVFDRGPYFGGISIGVADFDGDGKTDILVLSGDGSENGVPTGTKTRPRPSHGLTMLRNNGDLTFTQRFFYPFNGATRAVIGDFDHDGKPDIAAISLFPDWNLEEPRTFVYLANKGAWRFEASGLKRDNFAVWSSITAADVNGDGKQDIVLGLGNYPSVVPEDWTTRPIMKGRAGKVPSVLFLINNH